ncbi:DUF3237 family protein [Egicoccus sp. AB-alg2]|uniref:DUF3237 family protein n=1 Tax=Egicoccus sp. AB-alg2 TaxID=3242693 RepID=UPI00359D99FE
MYPNRTDRPVYRFEGKLTHSAPIGPVTDGVRADNRFEGTITEGLLRGAHVDGIDHFRVRYDGVGIVDAYEVVTLGADSVGVRVQGYVLPPAGMPVPSKEDLSSPDFAWPDVPFRIECFATFETASPAHAHLNRTTVVHVGSVNLATGQLVVEAYLPGAVESRPQPRDAYAGYPG